MNGTPTLERLRLAGASCGAVFAVLALIAYAINTGPSSGDGVTVVEYYSTHESDALAGRPRRTGGNLPHLVRGGVRRNDALGPAGIGAAGTVALYLVAIGCSTILGEIYGGVDPVDVSSEGYSDAHVLHVVGVGAAHMGNFAAAAYVGATAAAILVSGGPWRPLAWLGIAVAAFRLTSALIELFHLALVRHRGHRRLPRVPCMGLRRKRDARRGAASRHGVGSSDGCMIVRHCVLIRGAAGRQVVEAGTMSTTAACHRRPTGR